MPPEARAARGAFAQRGCQERGYWRWAGRHLRGAFPKFNRLLRAAQNDLARFAVALAEVLGAAFAAYEALDSTGAATQEGWLWGQADIGHSNALGWFEGLRVLAACTPEGVITGFCVAAASCHKDFLSARHAGGQGKTQGTRSRGSNQEARVSTSLWLA